MQTSASGRARLTEREGRRLKAYRDTRGIWTIGVGHTGRMSGPPVTPGMTITEAECDAMLAGDLAPVEAVIGAAVKVPLGQNEFDALASLGFNIGAGGLARSTVIRRLNLGDVVGAADAFMLWDKPAALVGRRTQEKAQFLTPDATTDAVAGARAHRLGTRAGETDAKATLARVGTAATIVVGGAGTVATAATTHHAPAVGLVAGMLALAQGAYAWWARRRADALAANAKTQRLLT